MDDRGRKIFNAFLIIVASTFLFLLPLTDVVEAFKTYQQEDTFSVTTTDLTTANITFSETLYEEDMTCLLYTSPSPRDRQRSRMPSSA